MSPFSRVFAVAHKKPAAGVMSQPRAGRQMPSYHPKSYRATKRVTPALSRLSRVPPRRAGIHALPAKRRTEAAEVLRLMLFNPGPWLFLATSKSAAAAADLCRVGIATITPFERDGKHLLATSLRTGGDR